jgi:excisionase family DNA binding protein
VLAVGVYGATRMLGLGRTTVLTLAGADEMPRLRFGRRVLFAVEDVEALVERRRAAAEANLHRLSPPGPAA